MARLPRSLKRRLELAGVPTPLEQAAVPKDWFVPQDIVIRRDRVCWRPMAPVPEFPHFEYAYTKRTPGPGLLEQFVALGDAPDEDILRYARHWGVLVICGHGLPASHSEDCHPMHLRGRGRYLYWEPLASWRYLARHAHAVLEIAAATYNGQALDRDNIDRLLPMPPRTKRRRPGRPLLDILQNSKARPDGLLYGGHSRQTIIEHLFMDIRDGLMGREMGSMKGRSHEEALAKTLSRQRLFVTHAVNCWLNWGRARPQIDWEGSTPTIELTTGGIWPMYADRLAGALALQLAYAVASSEGVATCFACGRFYTPTRRPAAGRRSFCPDCGLRAAWRTSKRVTRGRFKQQHA
jgi:hypothetical protein